MGRRAAVVSNWGYENVNHRLLPWNVFLRRAAAHAMVAVGGVVAAVLIGTTGYHVFARLEWVDAFLNASMILSGMGPVDKLETSGAKVFASFYALFSGLFFIAMMSVVIAPWMHRILHKMHIAEEDTTSDSDREES